MRQALRDRLRSPASEPGCRSRGRLSVTTHLSVRLEWHDRGWDGRICDQPHLNTSCIVHEHIREQRDDDQERASSAVPLDQLPGWRPPCSRMTGAFGDAGYVMT